MVDESIHFLEELLRIDDDPAAENTECTLMQNAGWDKVKLVGRIADNNCVPSVISALVSNDDVGSLSQKVGDFTFAFVTPLGTYDYYSTYASSPSTSSR